MKVNDSMSLTIKEIKEKLSRIETLEELHKHEASKMIHVKVL